MSLPKMRTMTTTGLCVFPDITLQAWTEWRSRREDLSDVITHVEQIIRTQKFEAAAADLLNPIIVACEPGLAD